MIPSEWPAKWRQARIPEYYRNLLYSLLSELDALPWGKSTVAEQVARRFNLHTRAGAEQFAASPDFTWTAIRTYAAELSRYKRRRATTPSPGAAPPALSPAEAEALAVLGLPPGADAEAIRRRYRELAQRYHPDRCGGDDTRMKAINAAYRVLAAK
jgi:DnaJ family protein C protein 19